MRIIKNCSVLVKKNSQDCTGKNITFHHDYLTVITGVPYLMIEFDGKSYYDRPDEEQVRRFCEAKGLDTKTVLLLCDKRNNPIYTPYLKPLDAVWGVRNGEKLTGPCAGGNYVVIKDPDEDWKESVIRVHDRYDTQEVWDALSR